MSTPLWAPWRMQYIERNAEKKPDEGCFFCEHAKDASKFRENLVLVVQEHAIALLNRYPFAPAHVLVAPTRHVPDIKDLSDEEYLAVMTLLRDARVRIERAVRCHGLNVGFNLGHHAGAGVPGHVHGHLVPRWSGDTSFMPVIADVRVIPEALDQTWEKLNVAFADVPGTKAP